MNPSLFVHLPDQEVAEATKVVVEQTNQRALVVAADRIWWTGQSVQFAHYVRSLGVDVLMVLPPDWAASCTVRSMVEHYAAVAAVIPVMVVTNVFARSHEFGLTVLQTLRDEVPNIVAVKDDLVGPFAKRMALLVHEQWAVLSGGLKEHHLDLLPYGCDGSFSSFIHFKPAITQRYWQAIAANNLTAALNVIRDEELPWFQAISTLPGGFDAALHGTFELFGYVGRWRRPPYYSLNDAEMEQLAAFYHNKGWL